MILNYLYPNLQERPAAPDSKRRESFHLQAVSEGGERAGLRGHQLHLLRLQHVQLLHLLRLLALPLRLVCRR